MPSTVATVDQLEISPFNVRTDKRDTDATGALEASLLKRGQLMPLVVHPLAGRKGKFGVFAGGRRMRSFRRLIERGDLPATHPIDIIVRDLPPAELIALSTTENLIRRDLRQYEVAAAVVAASNKGQTVKQIADGLGQEELWVKRQLRLGLLAPEIFAAFAADKLSFEQAAAFAATEDQELQLLVFHEIEARGGYPHDKTPEAIRRRLKIDDRELAKLLRLVGEEKYRAAGGRFELDLFADVAEQRGRLVDEPLLRQLAEDALAVTREELRRRTGRAELRFVNEPPRSDYCTDYNLQITVDTRKLDLKLPDGDIVCWLKPTDDGAPDVTFWWASRKAKHGSQSARAALPRAANAAISTYSGDQNVQAVRAVLKEEDGVTADGVEIFRSIRRLILRAGLIWDARAGRRNGLDYLVWSQLRQIESRTYGSDVGAGTISNVSADPAIAREHLDAMPANAVWEEALQEVLARPAFQNKDHAVSLSLWLGEQAQIKALGEAIVAGMAIERTLNAHGYRVPAHDVLGRAIGLTGVRQQSIRNLWTPTVELLGRLAREQLLRIAQPFVAPATLERWRKGRAADAPSLVAGVLADNSPAIDTAGKRLAARQWVHPLLRFTGEVDQQDEAGAEAALADGEELLERAAS